MAKCTSLMQTRMRAHMPACIIMRRGGEVRSGRLNEQTQEKILRLLFPCRIMNSHSLVGLVV